MTRSVEKLALLRAAMKQNGIDVYIIPLSDPHIGEYIPDHWKIISWLTGFTGSAAIVTVTKTFAGLWTDSRYLIQAERELSGSGFELMRPDSGQIPGYLKWIEENIDPGKTVGADGRIYSLDNSRKLRDTLKTKDISPDFECDLISDIWSDRPLMPSSRVWDHPIEFSGKDRSLKIALMREEMKKIGVDYHLLTSPDDIMWLLNVRGNDLQYTPLFFCFALAGEEQILLFTNETAIPRDIAYAFDNIGIITLPYEEVQGMVTAIPEGSSILISPVNTSVALYNSIPDRFTIKEEESIPARFKCIRNKTEIENIDRTMVRDGVALTKFFHWIENDLGVVPMSERSLVMRLHEFRQQQKDYICPSFATIVAFNEHSAIPHYSPDADTDVSIGDKGILLVDSGGQYPGGTTDITRSIAIGDPGRQQKKDFTLVLKGLIALANAKFPEGTKGYQLDILARKSLWENGLNFGHGTGHGVGYCLNVHEGPQSISPAANRTLLEPGMLVSNEPALYREGEYGIRTENLMICYEDEENEFGKFLKFNTVSLCYIDKNLIDKSLLCKEEIGWLDSYHAEVYNRLTPFLSEEEKIWLLEKSSPI
jgi:Xaa-Pro aminopeptidase